MSVKSAVNRFLICGIGVILVAGATTIAVDTRPMKLRAGEWAARAVASRTLPVTLEALSELPRPYWRAAFLAMTPAQRSNVWQEKFALLASTPGLSEVQRDFLLKYRAKLTPALYDMTNPQREGLAAEVTAHCATIDELFPDRAFVMEMKNLGSADRDPSDLGLVNFARSMQRVLGMTVVNADFGDCRCNSTLGACDCAPLEKCKSEECTEIILDCGCGGSAVNCNRNCALPAEDNR